MRCVTVFSKFMANPKSLMNVILVSWDKYVEECEYQKYFEVS